MDNLKEAQRAVNWLKSEEGKKTREYLEKQYRFYKDNGDKPDQKERFDKLKERLNNPPRFKTLEEAVKFAEMHAAEENGEYAIYMSPLQTLEEWMAVSYRKSDPMAPEMFGWFLAAIIHNA